MQLGGFPYHCFYSSTCKTPNDCLLYGCKADHGTPPRSSRSDAEVLYAKSLYVAPDHDPA